MLSTIIGQYFMEDFLTFFYPPCPSCPSGYFLSQTTTSWSTEVPHKTQGALHREPVGLAWPYPTPATISLGYWLMT